jgi:DNA (cytosine-5)-methyltransferase 1
MTNKPDCSWNLKDLDGVESRGVKVMTTFACGGGSSMGYKRAGCTIVAANDIDPEMAWHYKKNLNPPLYYLCPISDLITADLPPELFDLDILDGSPPCSTFSMAGSREKAWGKDKHFREGQTKQVLSDLFFDYLDLVDRLKPKVAIAENVKGMLIGNAKGYTKMVVARFKEMGYRPQVFLVNAADCGVPQKRERVFFCAVRDDIDVPPLQLAPKHRWISAGEACADVDTGPGHSRPNDLKYWPITLPGQSYSQTKKRRGEREGCFNFIRIDGSKPSCTLTSNLQTLTHWDHPRELNYGEVKRLGSFPDDYHAKSDRIGKYMIGMSVPPKMAQAVAEAVISQWLRPVEGSE